MTAIAVHALLGPVVQIDAATHPLDYELRRQLEIGNPVEIVSRSVIADGRFVTRDIPAGVLAAGNPCRIMRELEEVSRANLKSEIHPPPASAPSALGLAYSRTMEA